MVSQMLDKEVYTAYKMMLNCVIGTLYSIIAETVGKPEMTHER